MVIKYQRSKKNKGRNEKKNGNNGEEIASNPNY
jgi:hypothetical protein